MSTIFLSSLLLFQVKKMLDLCRVQVHDKNIKDTAVMDESADEDMRATKRTATIGSSGDIEGSILQTVAPCKLTDGECCTAELKSLKKVETNAGTITTIIIFEYSKYMEVVLGSSGFLVI